MRLFLAEKPTVARTIAESLGGNRRQNGCIQCSGEDMVTWCFGHLLEMAQPEAYNPSWRNRYDRRILPIVPEEIRLVPREDPGVRDQLSIIQTLLARASLVVNAGDPDREGQLLVDEVLEYLNWRGPVQRIFLASLDPKSVTKALNNLKDNIQYRSWRDAAATRRTVDWLGGINMSRAMTIFGNSIGLNGVLSLGRVQTPTLRLVVERDRQIERFVPVEYAQLVAHILHSSGPFTATLVTDDDTPGLDPEGRLIDFTVAESIRKASEHLPGAIVFCERKKAKEHPKLPYSLASLQSDMGAKHNLGAQQVLSIAQKLYETKLTSYPRTDCEYLPDEQFDQAQEVLAGLQGIASLDQAIRGADTTLRSKAWNSKKITAHHAIIPTGIRPTNLSLEEDQVYTAIALRYILQFWPPMEYEATKIRVRLDNATLWEATGKCVLNPGWTVIVKPEKEAEPDLPRVKKNDAVQSDTVDLVKKKTSPPAHFTEGTLINAMKNIHCFVEEKAAKEKLRETSGLGTEATRAGILEILKKRGYIEHKGKSLYATSKGGNVIDLCPLSMKDIVTTATLEDKLSDIQAGTSAANDVIASYVETLEPMIVSVFAQNDTVIPDLDFVHCPLCGKAVKRFQSRQTQEYLWLCLGCRSTFRDKNGTLGDHIVHGDVSDTYTCPTCGKPAVRHARRDGTGFFWGCSDYPKCRWLAPDNDGKPGAARHQVSSEYKCPLCGKAAVRHARRDGSGFFWGCTGYPACSWTAQDADGKPGESRRQVSSEFKCPRCGKAAVRHARRDGSGFFWGCIGYPACNWTTPDNEGRPKGL
ncbi:MAG: DNA topoisomerase 3 [Desulfovibrionaceae bacterium]|nr:DNA topoisomerase 3 [Desulfovibrionaceae bacterium]